MSEPLLLWPVVEYTVRSYFVKTKLQVRTGGKNLVPLNLTLNSVPWGLPYCVYTDTKCLKFKTFRIIPTAIWLPHFLSFYSEAYYSTWVGKTVLSSFSISSWYTEPWEWQQYVVLGTTHQATQHHTLTDQNPWNNSLYMSLNVKWFLIILHGEWKLKYGMTVKLKC
jgi:hypothetical protein